MIAPSTRAPLRGACVLFGAALVAACQMPNPAFDDDRDEVGGTGDGDGDLGTGDGDGDTGKSDSTGDGDPGDGDPGESDTGDGDGDSDGSTGDGDGEDQSCPEGLTACDVGCVDLMHEYHHCGECDSPCFGPQICGQGQCFDKKYIFVTSETYTGEFGGSSGGLEICNQLAELAGLPRGDYRPWVSDLQQSPVQWPHSEQTAYVLRNGPAVAWSWTDLTNANLLAPINRNEHGQLIDPSPACGLDYTVWTGTTDAGLPTENNCLGWTSSDANTKGQVGNAAVAGPGWSSSECATGCALQLPIYCVQG